VTARRRWLLLAPALLVLAWLAWPERDTVEGAAATRHARSSAPRSRAPARAARAQPTTPAFGAVKIGIAACDGFVERAMACSQLPDDAKIAIAEATKGWAQVTTARRDLETSCRDAASVHGDSLSAMGC
jgi:hypothetical protein